MTMDPRKAIFQQSAGLFAASVQPSRLAKFVAAIEDAKPLHIKDLEARQRQAAAERKQQAKAELQPRLTPEFLDTLAMLSNYAGMRTEDGFVIDVFDAFLLAGRIPGDLGPTDFTKP